MRVLILSASAGDTELTLSELRRSGLEPAWERAETETEYLAGLANTPDIVLADYHLPRFDAPRALHLLQERGLDIPLIVISGALSVEEAVACLRQGAAEVLLKDWLSGLGQAAARALEARRVRREKVEAEAALSAQAAELRISEARCQDLAAELQTSLKAADASLDQAAVRLAQLDRFRGEIISTVSHELRTPLNNIGLYLDLLDAGNPEKRPQYMATLHREVQFMDGMIKDILQIARLDLGSVSPVPEPVDAGQVLLRLADDRRELVRQRRLNLEACVILTLPLVMADVRMLTEVLSNLLTNAMNYTPAGGSIRLQGERQELESRPGVALVVSDTGPGISQEDLGRIFERYYRGAAARQSQTPGTGLGLAISEEIIRQHGGRITVKSVVGEGATFTVWLPALT